MTLVSIAAFGELHGVSKQAAAKWKSKGYLTFREGKVWVERSDQTLDHAGLGRFAKRSAGQPSAPTRQPSETTREAVDGEVVDAAELAALADAVLDPAADPQRSLATFLRRFADGELPSIRESETVKAASLAAKRLLEAMQLDGSLIDVGEAENVLFTQARSTRDTWMNFPTQVGPLIAADLGLEPGRVVEALTAHVHRQVEQLGDPEADFTAGEQG